jgi:isocitrate/isopropylmalate dehydrogenase
LSHNFSFFFPTDQSHSKYRTRDMGGEATTHEFTRAILNKMDTL